MRGTVVASFGRRRAVWVLSLGVLLLALSLCLKLSSAEALPASFASEGPGAGQISASPAGIAVEQESGDVYVADKENNRIEKFGPEGQFILAFGWGVADGESEELQICTTTTKCFKGLTGPGAGEFSGAEGIAVDNDPLSLSHGDVYVVDSGNQRVQKFDPEGKFLLTFGSEGTGLGEFSGLTGRSIAVDSTTGTVYVGDRNRVQRFGEEGTAESEVTFEEETGRIQNLALDSAKDIYLSGGLQVGVHSGVHKYDPTGKELGTPRDRSGFEEGLAISVGPGDELFVNDLRDDHHILTFNPEGEQTASFDRGEQEQNGQRGIAYSEHSKALYVLNGGAVRIVTPPPPGPFVPLGSETATDVQPTTATLESLVNPEGGEAVKYHFEYGTSTAYGESTASSAPLSAVNEVQSVSVSASEGSFTLAFKEESTSEIPFNATAAEVETALEAIPQLGSGQVAVSGEPGGPWSVEFIGARAGENVPELTANAEGLKGPPTEPSAVVSTTTPGFSLFDDREASAPLTGLQPRTEYHYRLVAENAANEVGFGEDQSFTTLPPVSIDSTSVSQVNASSARLEAELNPHGLESEYHFEYGTTTAYGESVPIPNGSTGPGTTDTTVANLIQNLTPSTTYHYRVVAHNTLGDVFGPDESFITQGAASILPDGRNWELVSPPNKHGSPLEPLTEEGGLIQAAANGSGMAYVALGPVTTEPKGVRSPTNTQLLASRMAGVWKTQDITTPHEEISIIHAGFPSEYKFFSEDLSSSIVEPEGITRLDPENPANTERTPYRREADGSFVPLASSANVPPGTEFGGTESPSGSGQWENGVEFRTASPDLSHIVLQSPQLLAPGFAPGFEPVAQSNLYELAGGSFTLVSVLPSGEPTSEAGFGVVVGRTNESMRGAISADGNHVVFEAGASETHLYLRDVGLKQTLQLDERQPGAAGGQGAEEFQAASEDGSKVFFTDASRLTPDATAKPSQPDLYLCEVEVTAGQLACKLSDLSVDPTPGEAANVHGQVSALDASGNRVFFAASGVLTTTPNSHGEVAVPGDCGSEGKATCNLYEYDAVARRVGLVAVLSSKDNPDWAISNVGRLGNLTARSSPNGRYFTFMSQRSLTGYDNRDAKSGQADAEVYVFDTESGKLGCVSCDPSGARPQGVFDPLQQDAFPGLLVDHARSWQNRWLAGSIPGWTLQWIGLALYQSRYLSNSGRMFFNATDALVPQDTNKVNDVYQYEPPGVGDCRESSATFSSVSGGCVNLISSGGAEEESAFLDASESGDDVFFLTGARLSPSDVDGALDIYDAHVCSASAPCPPPPSAVPLCEGDACQNPSPPPGDQTPGSLTYKGPENPPPPPPAPPKPKAKPTKAQLLAQALKACKKKQAKQKRLACEKQARKKYGAKKPASAKAKKTSKGKSRKANASKGRAGR